MVMEANVVVVAEDTKALLAVAMVAKVAVKAKVKETVKIVGMVATKAEVIILKASNNYRVFY